MYIFGVFCPKDASVYRSLCKSFGIGPSLSKLLCSKIGFTVTSTVGLLEGKHITYLNYFLLGRYPIGNDILIVQSQTFRRYKYLRFLKHIKLSKGLPINGQHTKNNAQTSRQLNPKFIKLTY